MNDEWKHFLCQMGDHHASIMVDVGVADRIRTAPPRCAMLRLHYKKPREDGLPTWEEFEPVRALEDRLEAFVKEVGDVYPGRVTTNGTRMFFVYTSRADDSWRDFASNLATDSGYEMDLAIEDDPKFASYWEHLYPTPDDWRVIRDMEVVAVLEKNGDVPELQRRVDHWVYFPSEDSAQPFVSWAVSDRFSHDVDLSRLDDDGRYCVRLYHVGVTRQRDLSSHTIALRRKAEEFGGEYDGWETSVEKKGAPVLNS